MTAKFHIIEGGGGPEDPMLEQRIGRLEDDMKEVKTDLTEIKVLVSRVEGKLDRTADGSAMWRMVIGTWIAGAGIVMLAVKLIQP